MVVLGGATPSRLLLLLSLGLPGPPPGPPPPCAAARCATGGRQKRLLQGAAAAEVPPPRRPDPRFAANVTLYHIYQRNLSDIPINMDLADVGGDLPPGPGLLTCRTGELHARSGPGGPSGPSGPRRFHDSSPFSISNLYAF